MHIYAHICTNMCVYIYYICGLCNIFWYHNMTLYKYQVPAMIVRAVLLQRSSRVTRIPWHSPLHPSRLLCCRSWCHLAQDWAKTSINGLDFKDSIRFRWVRSLQCDTLWNNFKHSDNFKHGLIMSRLTSKCEITISWLHHASLHFWKAIGSFRSWWSTQWTHDVPVRFFSSTKNAYRAWCIDPNRTRFPLLFCPSHRTWANHSMLPINPIPIGSMVLVYILTWMGYIDGIHVTIYSSTMDPMGYGWPLWRQEAFP
jgi:hypothetical protein